MASLIVRNIDDDISKALKIRASEHGVSAEAEHRRILEQALKHPRKKRFVDVLTEIPQGGNDEDFARAPDEAPRDVFEQDC
jgi:plasmid stability protein